MCQPIMRNRYRVPSHGDLDAELLGSFIHTSLKKPDKTHRDGSKTRRQHKKRNFKCRSPIKALEDNHCYNAITYREKPLFDGFGRKICKHNTDTQMPDMNDTSDKNEVSANEDEFAWLFSDIDSTQKGSTISDILEVSAPTDTDTGSEGLSQLQKVSVLSEIGSESEKSPQVYLQEAIAEEIKRKYAEIDALMEQLSSRKTKKRQRFSRRIIAGRHDGADDATFLHSPPINIHPIKRHKRLAQPIRNAVLIRSSMKKAWKGSLGSCCGMGCWASWQWINIRGVMSDYE